MSGYQPYLLAFHISSRARDLYQFDEAIYTYNGNVVFANVQAARNFAQKMNEKRDLKSHPEQAVKASQINAMALIDEILHVVIEEYRQRVNPNLMQDALNYLSIQVGQSELEKTLDEFSRQFPPISVYQKKQTTEEYLSGESIRPDGKLIENRQVILEELLMLWLANNNPAYSPYLELFDDAKLKLVSSYSAMIDSLSVFMRGQEKFEATDQSLIDLLRSPALQAPDSLTAQLAFIRKQWGGFLGNLIIRILSSEDVIREEEKPIFLEGGPGPAYVYEFSTIEDEPELFSPDRDWMPNLVLIAKNSYVWLDQLSKKYERPIKRLDQVPEAELEEMARHGLTGLWLIGLWERSMASQRIKQLRGNPEAVASAYSLFSYDIAVDLGGDSAYQMLREKAWKFGIRLASDMVPNHMGIDSRWVIEHPDWFVALDYSPFPSYTFNGPNLSWDTRVGIYLEDHYYNNQDAAVVFKRIDQWTGSEKYIYHGNDGTSMPWNDTAQLNYLLPEVREAVIQTILHVARKFPIIRFDAAMTLAKKHYQRLWFPEPGSGGDIPSRAEHGLTKDAFDQAFPLEFWREVVDRVAEEVPDTLLLAEAFWLMEGYFVRTLGMHRVYNSAFMNMLRDEKNQEYRLLIKNTLEFDPEILKRYVNFMNNPDERTAVDQFGKGDKYFGICTMMVTMPGLPMFGHGQFEGFTEKYGMEYRKAYWDEKVDSDLLERHRFQISPLARKRYLFAQVDKFLLYDFTTSDKTVIEDVFAYSNQIGEEKTLVVYHNKFATAKGWIKNATPYLYKNIQNPEDRFLIYQNLENGLGLHNDSGYYTIFRDQITGLEYLRNSQELCQYGLYLELNAYECHVFMGFREVQESEGTHYGQFAAYLQGGGVANIEEAHVEFLMQSIHEPLREIINPGMLDWLSEHRLSTKNDTRYAETLYSALDELDEKIRLLIQEISLSTGYSSEQPELIEDIHSRVLSALKLGVLDQKKLYRTLTDYQKVSMFLHTGSQGTSLIDGDHSVWDILLTWCVLSLLGKIADPQHIANQSRAWIDEWALGKVMLEAFMKRNLGVEASRRQVLLTKILVKRSGWFAQCSHQKPAVSLLDEWLSDVDIRKFLLIHRYQDVVWFNKEAFVSLCWWMFAIAAVQAISIDQGKEYPRDEAQENEIKSIDGDGQMDVELFACYQTITELLQAMENSGYQLERLIVEVKKRSLSSG